MTKRQAVHTLYVPTLLDKSGLRHIIPAKDQPSYCGATGSQHFPHDYPAEALCQRCVEGYVRGMAERAAERFFGVEG